MSAVLRTAPAWLIVLPFALWALVRVTGFEPGYHAVRFLAFTPYAAAGAVLAAVIVALAIRRPLPAVVGAVSAVALLAAVAPRAIGDRGEPPADARALRVLSVNVRFGDADARAVVALVRRTRTDVLSLQELPPDCVERLERAGLRDVLPHREVAALPGAQGMGLYSRFPLAREPAPPGTTNPFVTAVADVPGTDGVRVMAIHHAAPLRPSSIRRWRRDFRALPKASDGGLPRILVGDFNATLDHPEMRELLDDGYADAAEEAGNGLKPTWPRLKRYPPLVHIDHVLAPDDAVFGEVSIHDVADTDHRAVFAEVFLPRER